MKAKILLELNVTENKTYLNFWDSFHGNDVNAELDNDGNLLLHNFESDHQEEPTLTPIFLKDFLEKVKTVVKNNIKEIEVQE